MTGHKKSESLKGLILGPVWIQVGNAPRRKATLEEHSWSDTQLRVRYVPDDTTIRSISIYTARNWTQCGLIAKRRP